MSLRSLLTLPVRISMVPVRIALRVLDVVENRLKPAPWTADDPPDPGRGDEYWLYREEGNVTCQLTGGRCAWLDRSEYY